MGFTHYWDRPKKLPARKYAAWAKDVQTIVDAAGVPVGKGSGEDKDELAPVITKDLIDVNGIGDDAHENLYMPKEGDSARGDWGFCKTARKPYDVVVTAALIRFAHHFGSKVAVRSDGRRHEWEPGRALCERLFGEGVVPPDVRE